MSLSCSLGGFIRGQNMLRLSEKVLSLCICSQKKEVYKKGWTCFSAYIRSLHPCVLQLQHQTFILTMNRLCLSMPVITSKLLGTGIIALLKQAGEEEKKKETKRIPWTPDCCVNNEQLWGKCWMYSFIFFLANCVLILWEAGKTGNTSKEGMSEREDTQDQSK